MFNEMKRKDTVISYGPCQFPAFWFCHQRALKIDQFKPENYWKAVVSVISDTNDKVDLNYENIKLGSLEEAEQILLNLNKNRKAKVISIEEKSTIIPKPDPLNTVDLLVAASKRFKFSAEKTTSLAQNLYRNSFISYPRTESRAYSNNLEFTEVFSACSKNGEYKVEIDVLKYNIEYEKDESKDLGDHPPIIPVGSIPTNFNFPQKEDSLLLYDFIVRNFFASISDDVELNEVTTTFQIGDKIFTEKHSEVVNLGFTEYLELDEDIQKISNIASYSFTEDSEINLFSARTQSWKTAPEPYLGEHELIKLMEQHRIGTDGTIPMHIRKIIDRQYVIANQEVTKVEEEKNSTIMSIRRFIPTKLGLILAEGFEEIDEEMIKPKVRHFIEQVCKKIEKCEISYEVALKNVVDIFHGKLERFETNFELLEEKLQGLDTEDLSIGVNAKQILQMEKLRQGLENDYLLDESFTYKSDVDEIGKRLGNLKL
jgi:DNA topoisomerase III